MTGTPVLVATGLTKSYPSPEGEIRALDGADLTLVPGEAVALVGPSGCGKSTLLGVVGLMLRATAGEIVVQGEAAPDRERDRARLRNAMFGYVHQEYAIVDDETATHNVTIPLEYARPRVRRRDRRSRAVSALGAVGLAHATRTKASRLSGGQRQRVAIARALVNQPPVILADEPSAALDSATTDEIMTLLLGARERGAVLLIATHDPRVADRCDRVLTMKDGVLEHQDERLRPLV